MPTATLTIPARAAAFDAALEGLTRVNERLIETGRFPPLYRSGVRYRTEPREVWRHVADVYAEGWGDCEDLSAWRAAELRVSGEDPGAAVGTYRSGRRRYHAVVFRGDGSMEDPSRALGMPPPRRKERRMDSIDGIEEIGYCEGLADALLGEEDPGEDYGGDPEGEPDADIVPDPTPDDPRVTYDVRPTARGYRGVARVPLATGRALVTATSLKPDVERAAGSALRLAARSLHASKAAQMLLPPQARLALNVLQSPVGRAIAKGGLKVGAKIGKKLGKKLKFW